MLELPGESKFGSRIDYILGSDVTYDINTIPELIQSILTLSGISKSSTEAKTTQKTTAASTSTPTRIRSTITQTITTPTTLLAVNIARSPTQIQKVLIEVATEAGLNFSSVDVQCGVDRYVVLVGTISQP